MGSNIEFNDTLKIQNSDFPKDISVGKEYLFRLEGRRLFHLHPVRVFLVKEEDGKWWYVGHAQIFEQTINAIENCTTGKFMITKLYSKDYTTLVNEYEPPEGKQPIRYHGGKNGR